MPVVIFTKSSKPETEAQMDTQTNRNIFICWLMLLLSFMIVDEIVLEIWATQVFPDGRPDGWTDGKTDGRTDKTKSKCPPPPQVRGIKTKKH